MSGSFATILCRPRNKSKPSFRGKKVSQGTRRFQADSMENNEKTAQNGPKLSLGYHVVIGSNRRSTKNLQK